MKEIAGCLILEVLYQGRCSIVYRAARDDKTVVVKVPSNPTAEAKLVHEFHIGQRISSEYVVKFLELKKDNGYGHILIEEDDNAETLQRLIPSEGFAPLTFLSIAAQLAEGLQHIHESNVIHKDIKPANIIFRKDTGRIKYIDFNSATILRNNQYSGTTPTAVATTEATLAYISPELTGRINRRMDYRTDFYSLGVTFYHLLSGKLPFVAKNVVELVHCHLAKQPPALNSIRPQVPKIVADIVMKLMQKNAESRYQSASGLFADLKRCLEEFCQTNNVQPFTLAEQDVPEFFCIPGKLYGRESEISTLSQACDRVAQGATEVIMIAGHAGAGKSALVQEMLPVITAKGGFFLMGKYERLKSHSPYTAIVQALQSWIEQLLALGNEDLSMWKTKLLGELGNQGQLIVDILPELELIIGHQSPSPTLDASQAKMRFQLVFQKFIATIASQSNPILLFLDDMQWVDSASLVLLESLLCDRRIKHLLLVATYRNGDTEDVNSILTTTQAIQKAGNHLSTIQLQPLNLDTVNQWTADAMRSTIEDTLPLSVIIYQKTGGYPFFVKVFMQSLYDGGFLTQVGGRWKWNLEKIRCLPVTENLIGFLVQEIQKLSPETQELLQNASCIGHRFDASKLSQLLGRPVQDDVATLVHKGLLIQTNDHFCFAHDKVQEVVLGQIPCNKKSEIHLAFGRMLKSDPKQLAEAVDNLNSARDLIKDEEELLELAKMNLAVAKKYKQGIAYSSALNYLLTAQQCISLIDIWKRDYQFAVQLYKELADTEHLNTHYEESWKYSNLVLQNAQDIMDKLDTYRVLIVHHTVRGKFKEAIDTGMDALKLLGVDVDNTKCETLGSLAETEMNAVRAKIENMDVESLLDAPDMASSLSKICMSIADNILVASYFVDQVLHDYLVAKMVHLTLTDGKSAEAPMSLIAFAMTMVYKWNEIERGHALAMVAMKMSERNGDPVILCKTYTVYVGFIHHWRQSLDTVEPYINRALQLGEEAGEYQYTSYCIAFKINYVYLMSTPLANLEKQVATNLVVPYSRTNTLVLACLESTMLIIHNLTGQTQAATIFRYNNQTDSEYVMRWKQEQQLGMMLSYFVCKAQALFIHQEVTTALNTLEEAQNYVCVVPGVVTVPYYYYYSALVKLALYPTATSDAQALYLASIENSENQLKTWADKCPENNLYKILLVQAEKSRVFSQDRWETAEKYEKALEAVLKYNTHQDQALVHELAANFYQNQNRNHCAEGFLQTAFRLYERWGAKRKVNMMLRQYGEMVQPTGPNLSSFSVSGEDETISANSLRLLDLTTVLKTSQAISSEVDMKCLLTKTLRVLVSSAGAERGSFFMVEADDIFVQAEVDSDGQVQTLQHIPLSKWQGGARSIVDYAKRTHQTVLLSNASADRRFSQDPYLYHKTVQSVLCNPITRHEQLKAILYLENNLAPHVFSEQHMQILTLLGVQIAISLENATYYESVKSLNERLHLALQSGDIAIYCWNVPHNKLIWDENMYKLFGITKEEFDGTISGFISALHPDDVKPVEAAIQGALLKQLPFNSEYRIIRKSDGAVRTMESVGKVMLDSNGQPESVMGVVRDITRRKKLEQDRLQAMSDAEEKERNRAEEAEKYRTNLENFINQICHEIRNPMCGIFGNVDLSLHNLKLIKSRTEDLPEDKKFFLTENWAKVEDSLNQIYQCVKHQKAIVDDVLDLSKLETSQSSLMIAPFSLNAMVQEVVQLFIAPMTLKNIQPIVAVPEKDTWVCGDSRRLKIALTNIIANAVKFTQQGSIKVSLETKSLSELAQFVISVEDTGIGMTSEEQSNLFQRFACVAAAQFEGSGLGLYISKRFVECMGGKIEVNSTKGQGSVFSIHLQLPTTTSDSKCVKETHDTAPSIPSKRILVVEDNEVNQKILKRQLEQAGHVCEVAGNGQEALEKWKETSFDLIFMDIEMPVMGGFEATQIIRETEQKSGGSQTLIVGLSAYASKDFVESAKAAGMDDYITKPYEKQSIFRAVAKCLEKESKKRSHLPVPTETEPQAKFTRVDVTS